MSDNPLTVIMLSGGAEQPIYMYLYIYLGLYMMTSVSHNKDGSRDKKRQFRQNPLLSRLNCLRTPDIIGYDEHFPRCCDGPDFGH